MKAATDEEDTSKAQEKFQSTPPVKAATQLFMGLIGALPISIHAAREGGDLVKIIGKPKTTISIHAAREGGDNDACTGVQRG